MKLAPNEYIWAPSSEFVSSSIPSWQILNFACPAIQRGQGSGFLSEGSSWLSAYMSEQRRFWPRRLAWTFAARIGDKYQIRLTRSIWFHESD